MDKSLTPEQARERIVFIAEKDGRYSASAFLFVNEAVTAAVKWLNSGEMQPHDVAATRGDPGGGNFHISGYELLEAFRRLAREHWGCLARLVLGSWRVHKTDDVGEIVYLMVEDEKLGWRRRTEDSKEDFRDVFNFIDAFDAWEG